MKLTVRLSRPNKPIDELIREPGTLTGPLPNWGGIDGSRLYYGRSYNGAPAWIPFISAGLDNLRIDIINQGGLALLFIPIDNRYMVFSFGYGNHKLSGTGWEKDFGIKVVLNSIDPDKVKSLDAKTIDTVVMTRRVQLSKENRIRDFGFEIDRDLLKSIAGKASDESFAKVLSGGENLTCNCDVAVDTLLNKAEEIYEQYNSEAYQENYGWIDNIKVENDIFIIEALQTEVINRLNNLLDGNHADLDLASPDIIDFSSTAFYKIRGYSSRDIFHFIDTETIVNNMLDYDITEIEIEQVHDYTIESYNGDNRRQASWSLYKWIVCEVSHDGITYILSEGEWYKISEDYLEVIDTRYNYILNPAYNLYRVLPPTTDSNEQRYLANYVTTRDEFIFDRMLAYLDGPRNAIEICDIYTFHREFIHVKDGGSSSKLSHLFNQGYVSAGLFLSEVRFREDIIVKLRENRKTRFVNTIAMTPNANNYTIVYRILKRGAGFSLPFFTKVVLVEMYRKITSMGYQFRLEWVPKR